MMIVTASQNVQSQPCGSGSGAQTDIISQLGTNQKNLTVHSRALPIVSSTPSAIKKDLFMSRGWGASGMPYSMFYLNHYTKAQKAYVQSQVQMQQQKNQLQEHLQTSSITTKSHPEAPLVGSQEEESVISSDEFLIPKQFSQTTSFNNAITIVPQINVQAEKLRSDSDYIDNGSAIWRGSNSNASRRQYTVPQLFVSYGWGPMG